MRYLLVFILLLLLFAACLVAGGMPIGVADVWDALWGDGDATVVFVVQRLRLPAALTAICAGVSFSLGGHAMQTLLRNPLADPSLIGVGAGAALGAAVVTMSPLAFSLHAWLLPMTFTAAFLGALGVGGVLSAVAGRAKSVHTVLIAGLMLSFLLGSCVTLLSFFAPAESLRRYVVWGMGTFSAARLEDVPLLALLAVGCGWGLWRMGRAMDALLLGDDYAGSVGIRVPRARAYIFIMVSLLTAGATCVCGPVAFLGLSVPHIARMLVPSGTHRRVLPMTMLVGAVVSLAALRLSLLPADGRVLPLSALTPLVGVPVCLWLLMGRRT